MPDNDRTDDEFGPEVLNHVKPFAANPGDDARRRLATEALEALRRRVNAEHANASGGATVRGDVIPHTGATVFSIDGGTQPPAFELPAFLTVGDDMASASGAAGVLAIVMRDLARRCHAVPQGVPDATTETAHRWRLQSGRHVETQYVYGEVSVVVYEPRGDGEAKPRRLRGWRITVSAQRPIANVQRDLDEMVDVLCVL